MKLGYLGVFCLLTLLLQSCGTAHVQPNIVSDNLDQYSTAYISSINVQSKEQNGDSLAMNEAMKEYAKRKLSELISNSQYEEVTTTTGDASLEFNLDLDIIYGNRAARYFVGFGAGKGSVNSTFEVVDSKTKEIKYSSSGTSDLSMGGAGGSMEAVIKQNIDKLLDSYPTPNM